MTREEAIKIFNGLLLFGKAPCKKEELEDLCKVVLTALEQEPKTGHWINKQHLLSSCSAECSSCHERSNGYVFDNGFSLEYEYYDFCPKCGADMREVEE